MDFFDALRQVADGKEITKLAWDDREIRIFMAESNIGNGFCKMVCIRKPNGEDISGEKIFSTAKWFISEGDFVGSDWVAVD